MRPDFLKRVWDIHSRYERLAMYAYRYDEVEQGALGSLDFSELDAKCVLRNPENYGGCLTVRKKWLMEINGYEQHPLFGSGNHANGRDIYTRLKILGLAIQWEPSLELYHPWHPFTLESTSEHACQHKVIAWRRRNMHAQAFQGIDPSRDCTPASAQKVVDRQTRKLAREARWLKLRSTLRRSIGRGDVGA